MSIYVRLCWYKESNQIRSNNFRYCLQKMLLVLLGLWSLTSVKGKPILFIVELFT